MSYLLNTVIWK